MQQVDSAPLIIEVLPDLLLAVFFQKILQVILRLLPRSSRGASKQAVSAVLAAGSTDITVPTEI